MKATYLVALFLWIYLKVPPPHTHTERKAKLRQWRQFVLRAEGGISGAMLRKCSPLTQFRRQQEKPGPLLLVYFMVLGLAGSGSVARAAPGFSLSFAAGGPLRRVLQQRSWTCHWGSCYLLLQCCGSASPWSGSRSGFLFDRIRIRLFILMRIWNGSRS